MRRLPQIRHQELGWKQKVEQELQVAENFAKVEAPDRGSKIQEDPGVLVILWDPETEETGRQSPSTRDHRSLEAREDREVHAHPAHQDHKSILPKMPGQ